MFCKTCGAQLNNDQVVCLNCGCAKGTGIKYCANCGKELMPDAAVCMNCGVAADFGTEKAKGNTGIPGLNNGWCPADKDKTVAILLAFFLGSIGIHNFYLGETKKGILRLCLCWCGIGSILAFVDFIKMLTGSYTVSAEKLV